MVLFRGIQEYIALDANNITLFFDSDFLLTSLAIYSCIPLKAIQYHINTLLFELIQRISLNCMSPKTIPHTIPGLLHSQAELANSYPYACVPSRKAVCTIFVMS